MGTVEELEHLVGDVDLEEKDQHGDDQHGEDQPEEKGVAAPTLMVGLRAIGGVGGTVKLSLCCRERWVGGTAINHGGLGRWIHPVCHGCVVLLCFLFNSRCCVVGKMKKK